MSIKPKNPYDFPPVIVDSKYPKELADLGLSPAYKLIKEDNRNNHGLGRLWIYIKDFEFVEAKDYMNGTYTMIQDLTMGVQSRQMFEDEQGGLHD